MRRATSEKPDDSCLTAMKQASPSKVGEPTRPSGAPKIRSLGQWRATFRSSMVLPAKPERGKKLYERNFNRQGAADSGQLHHHLHRSPTADVLWCGQH